MTKNFSEWKQDLLDSIPTFNEWLVSEAGSKWLNEVDAGVDVDDSSTGVHTLAAVKRAEAKEEAAEVIRQVAADAEKQASLEKVWADAVKKVDTEKEAAAKRKAHRDRSAQDRKEARELMLSVRAEAREQKQRTKDKEREQKQLARVEKQRQELSAKQKTAKARADVARNKFFDPHPDSEKMYKPGYLAACAKREAKRQEHQAELKLRSYERHAQREKVIKMKAAELKKTREAKKKAKQQTSPRQQAIKAGASRYQGLVCTKHPELNGERVITSGECVGCRKERRTTPTYREQRAERVKAKKQIDLARFLKIETS